MFTTSKLNRSTLSLGACGLAFLVGCATVPSSQRREASESEPRASSEAPTDVLKTSNRPENRVSDDQRADFEKAVAVYQKLRKSGSLKGSDCDEAASAFRRVADENPTMLIARHNEASVYMECGRKQEGARIEEDLARKNYAPALANLGYASLIGGDSAQAESYFTRSIAADPQAASIAARLNMAQILRERARRAGSEGEKQRLIKDAITHIRAVLALDGNSLQAYATMCFIYFDLQLYDAAILIGTQAIKKADEIATGRFDDESASGTVDREKERASSKGKKGKKGGADAADEAPRTAKETGSGKGTGWTPEMKKYVAVVHNTLGLVSLNKKSYKDAIPSFKKAVELDPELYEARLNLAAVSLRFRDYATAEDQFKAVVAAQPRNYEAIIGLGVALRGARKYEDAEAQYMAAQKVDPSRADSYFNLGLLYQDYKGSERPTLEKAQQYYRDYLGRASGATKLRRDAEKRIKDIDELFVALAEAKKLQEEADRIQAQSEAQQKKMEEEMKRQDEAAKKGTAPPPETPAPPPSGATTPPASSTTPPSASAPTLN
jgi:tetratricopeptide (TPR) repeat protein